jgi:uncharacterized protein YndB with AHSA1/START domain
MLRLLKWLFYIVVIGAVVIVAGAMVLPSTVTVTRSVEIAAPPEKVFAIVGDLKRFNEFSPWADIDPNTKYTFEGPEQGVGQKMGWVSENEKAGSGSMTLTDYQPPKHVAYDLHFDGMGTSEASWDLAPTTTGTKATWWFSTQADGIVMRWLGLMFDRWIGADYEKGLARLKAVAEKP